MVQKQNSVALKAIANQATGRQRFKGRRPQIPNIIAEITTPFITVLMLCINLQCSFKLIKSIKAMFYGVKILAVIYSTCLCKIK